MVMRMNVANCSPDIHAHAEAEQAFDLFFDGIEEEMTRLPLAPRASNGTIDANSCLANNLTRKARRLTTGRLFRLCGS